VKEGPLQQEFERCAQALRADRDAQAAADHLAAIQSAIRELKDEGFPVALEVRPNGYKCGVPCTEYVFANGTITVENVALEFALLAHGRGMRLEGWLGNTRMGRHEIANAEQVKRDTRSMALKTLARARYAAEFDVPAGGFTAAKFLPLPRK
jgi:hypothetical protein